MMPPKGEFHNEGCCLYLYSEDIFFLSLILQACSNEERHKCYNEELSLDICISYKYKMCNHELSRDAKMIELRT